MKRDWYWKAFKESKSSQFSMAQMIKLLRGSGCWRMNARTSSKASKVRLGEKYIHDGFFGSYVVTPVISKRTGKILENRMEIDSE